MLKQLLQIAKEPLQAEKEVPPEEDEDRGKAALTELFNEVRTAETPIMVERVVADIDEIVRLVRFPGWQGTQAGEREVKKALRKALFKYKLHADEELFEKGLQLHPAVLLGIERLPGCKISSSGGKERRKGLRQAMSPHQ